MNSPVQQHPLADKAESLVDSAAHSTGRVIDSAERVARQSLGSLAGSVESARQRAGPALHDLAASAEDLARESAHVVRERALRARDTSADMVRAHPLQAVLIAAGIGAALVLLGRLISRDSGRYR